jgi:hypothetical protein
VTNFGALAILGLPKIPERQLRFLLALETVTAREGGWRKIKADVLAAQAGASPNTSARARAELADAGLIEYRRGTGPGHPGSYRIRIDGIDKPPKNAATVNVPKNAATVNALNPAAERSPNGPSNARTPKAATSADASTALEPIALEPSALSRAARNLGAALATLGATDQEIDFTIGGIKNSSRVDNPAAYMSGVAAKPDGVARLLGRTRRVLAKQDPGDDPRPVAKPPWCGECDQQTRLVDRDGDHPARCIRCHPLSVRPADPAPEPEPYPHGCDNGWIDADDGANRPCPKHRPGPTGRRPSL